MEQNHELFLYNTDRPEPEGCYKYIFLYDLVSDNKDFSLRDYITCDCNIKEKSKKVK